MPELTSEEKVRKKIDAMLTAAGWSVQAKDRINLSAARGVAIGERLPMLLDELNEVLAA